MEVREKIYIILAECASAREIALGYGEGARFNYTPYIERVLSLYWEISDTPSAT